jgi:hypothetical protein
VEEEEVGPGHWSHELASHVVEAAALHARTPQHIVTHTQ